MNSPVAQIVALTCHGNAVLRGIEIPSFFPTNSTCKFVESIRFARLGKTLFGTTRETSLAATADEWLAGFPRRGATAIRLLRQPQDNPQISDRMSSGFVGGGGMWMMEVLSRRGQSDFWAARWEIGDRTAPESRIWQVTYLLLATRPTVTRKALDLTGLAVELRSALIEIHAFSSRHNCAGFTECFADALRALDHANAEIPGTSNDIAPHAVLNAEAGSLLKAASRSWVFGAMGSWNDMGFEGAVQTEYEKVSDRLFDVVTRTIAETASSTAPTRT